MGQDFAWRVALPENHGLDSSRLDVLWDGLAARDTKCFLVVHHDRIVGEWYAEGYGPAVRHYTASLAKALVGGTSLSLVLSDGLMDIDDPAWKYIPAWKDDPQRAKITIRHLATHSSGIEDSTTPNVEHEKQPGWKGAFWRGRSNPVYNPISVALHQAPVIFEPGTGYAYSNPGMAALAYAVTASLREAPQPDIRSLLKARIMEPIGVLDDEWSIGYGRTYETDGLPVCANWGGGSYTARAVARLGRLMLRGGNWEGKQLVREAWIRKALAYASTPLPDRPESNPQPGSGLCWWTNFDGIWPSLPRDAFAGAGAGNQLLLVIPCRDLIVVRNGELLGDPLQGEGFWGGLDKHLFTPLMDAFLDRRPGDRELVPYPPSPVIMAIQFAPPSTIVREGFHGDNWPITWGDDDDQYTAYGDGRGFEPYTDQVLSLGYVKVIGPATDFHGENVRSTSGERLGHGLTGAKASGMLVVDAVLYMWARNMANSQLAWSADHGKTWTWCDWRFTTSFGCPTFLNFGRNYAGARDEYVYVYSHDSESAYEPADRMVLARVPRSRITEREAYQFFAALGPTSDPLWTRDISQRGPVFVHPGYCRRSGISYNAALGRYLWWQQRAEEDVDTRFSGGFGIYDAPEPWGPWTTAYFTAQWDTGPGETGSFPTKWISDDGQTCYLVFSGNDWFSVRKARLILRE